MEKRNWKIYFEWIEGKEYNQLAEEFGLSHATIKEICHKHLPQKVTNNPWLRTNAYKRYREWVRNKK